jgi:hypothetical protein
MDTFIKLGDIILQKFEVPAEMPGGGDQTIKVHQIIGGKRIVHAMGRNDADITWEGMFVDEDAQLRCRYFDTKRASGEVLVFSYFGFRYKVIIKSFIFTIKRAYEIRFNIALQVIEDLTLPVTVIFPTNFDDLITQAMIKASDLGVLLSDSSIDAALALLVGAMNLIPSFNNAPVIQLNKLSKPLSDAQNAAINAIKTTTEKLFA